MLDSVSVGGVGEAFNSVSRRLNFSSFAEENACTGNNLALLCYCGVSIITFYSTLLYLYTP